MTPVFITSADVLLVTLVMRLACPGDAQTSSGSSNNGVDQSENNIAFDLPDLTVTVNTPSGGEYQIEAYKSVNNDRIMLSAASQTPSQGSSQLFWVSVGSRCSSRPPFLCRRDIVPLNEQRQRRRHRRP